MEPEEYSYFDLHDAEGGSWYEGFSAGKAEVLDTLLPEAEALIQAIDDAALTLAPEVQELVDLISRWIDNSGGEEE